MKKPEDRDEVYLYTDYESVVQFLEGKRKEVRHWYAGHRENAQNVRHFLLSMGRGQITPSMTIDQIWAIGKFWAKWVGIRGGMMVFHPFRILPAVKEKLTKLIQQKRSESDEEYEKKHWAALRDIEYLNLLGLGVWTDGVYWSPHFHIEGFGYICDSGNFYRLTGNLVREIRNVKPIREWDGQRMQDDYAALAYYMLSHCGVIWGKKSVAWIGCMTPTNLKRMQEKPQTETYQRVCPDCTADQIEYQLDEYGEPGEPAVVIHGDNAGQIRLSVYVDKWYRYHIVTGSEKDAQRERRRAERAERQRSRQQI